MSAANNAMWPVIAVVLALIFTVTPSGMSQQKFTGYPPLVHMQFFQPCSQDSPCDRTDEFRLEPVPKGCCVVLVTNGDGQGKNGVTNYSVFLNDREVIASGNARNASAKVTVQRDNSLKVVLSGPAGSRLVVMLAYDPDQPK